MDFKDRIVELRRVPASELVENPKNWRRHGEDQRRGLRSLVEKIGFAGAELVRIMDDGRLMLIDGHLRKDEYKKQSLPVLVTDLSEAEADLLLATFDPIGALATTDDEALESLLSEVNATFDDLGDLLADVHGDEYIELPEVSEDAGAQIDKSDELLQKWQVERGQLWVIPSKSGRGEHRLLCGDSTNADDVARVMSGERADAVVADPPYNMDMTQGQSFLSSSTLNMRERVTPLSDFEPESIRVWMSLEIPTFYLYCNKHLIPKYLELFTEYNFNILVWCKTNPTPFTNGTYLPDVEYVMVFTQPSKIWNNSINPTETYSKFYVSSKLEGRKEAGGDYHPTIKPLEFVKRHIQISAKPNGIVADPFLGSGTTLVACEQTGRLGRGLELEPKYCAVILQRLTDMGLTPKLTSDKFASQS